MKPAPTFAIAALLLASCGEPQASAPEAPVAAPVMTDIATPDTTPGALPPGWTTQMTSASTVVYAKDGKIYFQFPGDAASAEINTLSYEIGADVAGEVTFDFSITITGDKPVCEAALMQGDKGERKQPSSVHIALKLDKAAGQTATASFSCHSTSQVYGFLIKPKIIVTAKP